MSRLRTTKPSIPIPARRSAYVEGSGIAGGDASCSDVSITSVESVVWRSAKKKSKA